VEEEAETGSSTEGFELSHSEKKASAGEERWCRLQASLSPRIEEADLCSRTLGNTCRTSCSILRTRRCLQDHSSQEIGPGRSRSPFGLGRIKHALAHVSRPPPIDWYVYGPWTGMKREAGALLEEPEGGEAGSKAKRRGRSLLLQGLAPSGARIEGRVDSSWSKGMFVTVRVSRAQSATRGVRP
jgi:hypothetical protein